MAAPAVARPFHPRQWLSRLAGCAPTGRPGSITVVLMPSGIPAVIPRPRMFRESEMKWGYGSSRRSADRHGYRPPGGHRMANRLGVRQLEWQRPTSMTRHIHQRNHGYRHGLLQVAEPRCPHSSRAGPPTGRPGIRFMHQLRLPEGKLCAVLHHLRTGVFPIFVFQARWCFRMAIFPPPCNPEVTPQCCPADPMVSGVTEMAHRRNRQGRRKTDWAAISP